ncbi:MAG: chemotaxis protein CheA [Caldilineaceae bacterium]
MQHYDLTTDEAVVFFEEANELLESLDRDLVAIEDSPDDELIHRIFRALHTLKGAAGSVGHDSMALLAHAAETQWERVRNHEISVTKQMANLLFVVVENLRLFLEDVLADRPAQVDVAELIEQINGSTTEIAQAADPVLPSLPTIDKAGFAAIQAGLDDGLNLLVVYAEADMAGIAPMARLLQMYMHGEQVAQIVASSPSGAALEQGEGTGALVLVLMSDLDRAEIEAELSNIFEIAVLRVADMSSATHLLQNQSVTGEELVSDLLASLEDVVAPEYLPDAYGGDSRGRTGEPAAPLRPSPGVRTVRTNVERLDNLMNLAGELVTDRNRLFQVYEDLSHLLDDEQMAELNDTITHLSSITDRIHDEIFKARMQPIEFVFNKFPRFVRQICQELGKDVELVVTGQETEVDRSVIEQIGDPILHLVRNAIDHGIETIEERLAAGKEAKGCLSLSARSEEGNIVVSIMDDGRGVDAEKVKRKAVALGLISEDTADSMSYAEAIDLIFAPGLSTSAQLNDLSGRGVGMDVVHNNIQRLNGSVVVYSVPYVGTTFDLRLPLTLAIIPTLLVEIHEQVFALPLSNVVEIFDLSPMNIQYVRGKEAVYIRGEVLSLFRLSQLFGLESTGLPPGTSDRAAGVSPPSAAGYVITLSYRDQRLGVVVSGLLGKQDVVIKALGHPINNVRGLTGATLLGDGRIGLIVDIAALVEMASETKPTPEIVFPDV